MKFATTTDGISLHPFKVTDTPSFAYIDNLFFLPPMRYDQDTLQLIPFAAAAVKTSPDKTAITFILRDDLKWSDGHAITAADYAWTWSMAIDKANNWPLLGSYEPYIDGVNETDPRTIEVKLKSALAIGLDQASSALSYVLPKHVWQTLDWNDPIKNSQILKPTVVAGPYALLEWNKDQYASFAANRTFFLGRPQIDRVSYRIYGSSIVATQALINGEVDVYAPGTENWSDIKANPKLNAYQWDAANNAVTYIGFNTRQESLKDKAVRQALNYALDKDAIVDKLTSGIGKRATTMYVPTNWAYRADVNPYKYDPAKAKQLLDDAGWKVSSNGTREKNGQPLKLMFIYGPNTTTVRELIAQIAQQQWNAVGADVAVRGMEWGAYLKVTKEGPYDWSAFVNAYIPSVDPDIIWWKKGAGPQYNRSDYHNSQVEQLYEDGLKELDRNKRKTIYGEIQGVLTEESPWIWLYYQQGYTAMNQRVKGVRITKALGLNPIWEWSLR